MQPILNPDGTSLPIASYIEGFTQILVLTRVIDNVEIIKSKIIKKIISFLIQKWYSQRRKELTTMYRKFLPIKKRI